MASQVPVPPAELRQPPGAGASWLLRFLFALSLISGLTLLYVWQTSTVTTIQQQTLDLRRQITDLERQNASLILEVAAWSRPDYIEKQAIALGMVPAPQPEYVQAAMPVSEQRTAADQVDELAAWWQEVTAQAWDRLLAIPQVSELLDTLGLR